MDITVSISENTAMITLAGMADTLNAERILAELDKLPEEAVNIEFDMENITYISSHGLRALLKALDIAQERGGEFKVTKSSDFVKEILATVGFGKLFSIL